MGKIELLQKICSVNNWELLEQTFFDVTNNEWTQLPLRVVEDLTEEEAIEAFKMIEQYILRYQELHRVTFKKCIGNVIDSKLFFIKWK